jgi:hypothetical protein
VNQRIGRDTAQISSRIGHIEVTPGFTG